MASYRKVKGKVFVEVYKKGQRASKLCGTKAEARAWATEKEHRLDQSKGVLQGKTLGQAMERYAIEESPKKRGSAKEIIRLRRLGREPIAALQLGDLTDIDFVDFIERMENEGLLGSSINRYLSAFSAVLKKCRHKSWRWLHGNPIEGLEWCEEPRHRNKIINKEEQANILAALGYEEDGPVITTNQRIAIAFLFAIETAMRHSEIWNMRWEHINWDECGVHLPTTKNGDERDVPLSKRAIQLLRKFNCEEKGPVIDTNPGSSEVLFRRARDKAGYKKIIHFHDTRHTAITLIAPKFSNIVELARITGHKNPQQLMTYYNASTKTLAERLG